MQKLFLASAFFLLHHLLFAQTCGSPLSSIDLHANNIQARILDGGDLFTDLSNGQFIPNPVPGAANPGTIFAAGIWLGGVDLAGNLKLATVDYRSDGKSDFSAGPLRQDGTTDPFTCANWDRHFRVTSAEVDAFRNAGVLNASQLTAQFPGIAGWPAVGNPFFSSIWGYDLPYPPLSLAGFVDANNDGQYNPLLGDYPAVVLQGIQPFVPTEIIWCVFNDEDSGVPHPNSNGKSIQAEIQLTAWAFNTPDQALLNNTIFTSHKIINRSVETLDSFFISLWIDVDLGCYSDDYVGCKPSLSTMFAYNQDAVDGQPGNTCQGTPTFPGAPPVQSITLLNKSLDKFLAYNNASSGNPPVGTTDPYTPLEIYEYMTGSWRDGLPFTYGGSGYGGNTPTDYLFPDDPADPNGWSMCTANIPFSDRRVLGSHKVGLLAPGQVEELDAAWAVHFNVLPPCNLGNTLTDVQTLHDFYDSGFTQFTTKAPDLPGDSLDLFPNPTSGTVSLRYGNLTPVELRAYDAAGRLVFEKTGGFDKKASAIEMGVLASGIYTLQIVTDQGVVVKKLAVAR